MFKRKRWYSLLLAVSLLLTPLSGYAEEGTADYLSGAEAVSGNALPDGTDVSGNDLPDGTNVSGNTISADREGTDSDSIDGATAL